MNKEERKCLESIQTNIDTWKDNMEISNEDLLDMIMKNIKTYENEKRQTKTQLLLKLLILGQPTIHHT